MARAKFTEGKYTMVVRMGGLPPLGDGYYYEGWIVNRKTREVVSTGRAELVGEEFVNGFESFDDLRAFDFFVLTLEPDDGNPAPDEHILEGTFR
jgi:hypothetical protein